MNMYKELLLDHYKMPRNRGTISAATFSSGEYNPSCGDSVCFSGIILNSAVTELKFSGQGCVISQAVASILSEHCCSKTVAEIMLLTKDDIMNMIGMELGPMRLKCALLPLEALQKGLQQPV